MLSVPVYLNCIERTISFIWTISFHLDIDECENDEFSCDTKTSECQNTNGSYVCNCIQGYIKNGTECIGEYH